MSFNQDPGEQAQISGADFAAMCDQMALLNVHNAALVADLTEAAATLRRYEALHRAKGTAESSEKAEVNAALASRFEATLAQAGKARQPLNDKQVGACLDETNLTSRYGPHHFGWYLDFARAIERAVNSGRTSERN